MLRSSWVSPAIVLALVVPSFGQNVPPPATRPPEPRPIIPASVAPQPESSRPLVARPLTADPRFQPAPSQFPPSEPRLLPPGFTPPQPPILRPENPLTLGLPQQQQPGVVPPPAQGPTDWNATAANETVRLPQNEQTTRLAGANAMVRKFQDGWQVWSGSTMFRDFGRNQADAEEAVRLLRELHTTEWVTIGGPRPTVEYGLTNGKPHLPTFAPKVVTPIDLRGVRVENIRGVWCLRDDANILVNFGREKGDAEQTLAVIRKYGFNRLGVIGNPAQLTVLFAQPGLTPARPGATPGGLGQLSRVAQEQSLTRTGIELPGVGYVGERVALDPKKIEVRRERSEYILAHGSDVLARFGMSEWSARDALRVVQDMRATEFCRFNADVTFFLVNGQPPARPPFSVQCTRFDAGQLSIKPASDGQTGVYEANGRLLYSLRTREEADALVLLLKHYRFDQQCQMGLSGRNGLKFLARSGR